jgi:murein DD-endopeptidase MepM/ murein hydrolase activator NlpD
VLTSQNTSELTSQLSSVETVMDKEALLLDRLEASRVLLEVQEQEVADAKEEVAVKREAAAKNLSRKRALTEEAELAEERVEDLVTMRAEAQEAAVEAREADLERLQALRQERDRISEMLRRRAEAARQRAAAAAAAAAAAEAAADTGSRGSKGFLDFPVVAPVTSSYGMRVHPVTGIYKLHDGTDFGVACGTPVHAAASGTVIQAANVPGYGNQLVIDHGVMRGVGLATSYNPLSSFAAGSGSRVSRGQLIGYSGGAPGMYGAGYSTGCHLHFMVYVNGGTTDPMGWL